MATPLPAKFLQTKPQKYMSAKSQFCRPPHPDTAKTFTEKNGSIII